MHYYLYCRSLKLKTKYFSVALNFLPKCLPLLNGGQLHFLNYSFLALKKNSAICTYMCNFNSKSWNIKIKIRAFHEKIVLFTLFGKFLGFLGTFLCFLGNFLGFLGNLLLPLLARPPPIGCWLGVMGGLGIFSFDFGQGGTELFFGYRLNPP